MKTIREAAARQLTMIREAGTKQLTGVRLMTSDSHHREIFDDGAKLSTD